MANFGKNSKALYSCSRCVFNLAPGSEDENPPILVACPKNNDGPRSGTFALLLEPDTMTYEYIEDFDVDTWLDEVRNRAKGKATGTAKRRLSEDEAVELLADQTETATDLRQRIRDAGASRDHAIDLIKKVIAGGQWETWQPKSKNAPTYIGTPTAIKARREWWAEKRQKKLEV